MTTNNTNDTHNSKLKSWVESANNANTDFPIQNLPFGVFRKQGSDGNGRVGIAIGEMILDVGAAQKAGLFNGKADVAAQACRADSLNAFMALGRSHWSALRMAASKLLGANTAQGKAAQKLAKRLLLPMSQAEMLKPVVIGDYTDFTASIYHATNAGKVLNAENALVPNYKYLPIAYHGRCSSIILSGTNFHRPYGQTKARDEAVPSFGPSKRFDYELELGVYVGQPNALGQPVPVNRAHEHLFGICLVNDWSARDIQGWEMNPLGPFVSKSTVTSISAWVVTMEALAPFHRPAFERAEGDPQPFPYLYSEDDQQQGGLDVSLSIDFSSAQMRAQNMAPVRVSNSSTKHLYWTVAQQLAHHTSNGCNMNVGDLFATGTVSGPTADARGCMLELTWGGRDPYTLPNGEQRRFLEDGDEVTLGGFCERDGFRRIGLGECKGMVMPAC
jgi:fumarylacetoacetase